PASKKVIGIPGPAYAMATPVMLKIPLPMMSPMAIRVASMQLIFLWGFDVLLLMTVLLHFKILPVRRPHTGCSLSKNRQNSHNGGFVPGSVGLENYPGGFSLAYIIVLCVLEGTLHALAYDFLNAVHNGLRSGAAFS